MTVSGSMKIGEVLNAVYDEEVGWRPATGQIKPVHVANGLVRAVTGEFYDTASLVEFLISWKKDKVPDEERSYKRLVLEGRRDAYGYFADSEREFDRARRYLRGLLNADNAVYPSAENSALTLTCREMASRSHQDSGLGDFGAALLRSGTSELLAKALLRVLDVRRPEDPLTAIAWPLLGRDAKPARPKQGIGRTLTKKHHRQCLNQLGVAAERLARHEEQQGNRLRTLERIVHFVCLATHAHAQALAARGVLDSRPPLLMAVIGGKRSDLAAASERSLESMYGQFEEWLISEEAARLRERKPLMDGARLEELSVDGRTVRSVLRQILSAKQRHEEPDEETLDARMADFEDAKRSFGKDDPALLMAHALVRSYLREYESGGPRSFLQGLARKAGLLYPHFQGNSRDKRVRPSVAILDVLVRACVPPRESLPLDEFLDNLWGAFGLVVGGRRGEEGGDAELLLQNRIDIDPSHLVANTDALVDLLVGMGLARRFADNVTFVGDGLVR